MAEVVPCPPATAVTKEQAPGGSSSSCRRLVKDATDQELDDDDDDMVVSVSVSQPPPDDPARQGQKQQEQQQPAAYNNITESADADFNAFKHAESMDDAPLTNADLLNNSFSCSNNNNEDDGVGLVIMSKDNKKASSSTTTTTTPSTSTTTGTTTTTTTTTSTSCCSTTGSNGDKEEKNKQKLTNSHTKERTTASTSASGVSNTNNSTAKTTKTNTDPGVATPSSADIDSNDNDNDVDPLQEDMHNNRQQFVSPKDFELMKVIGMGAFGKVLQVRNKHTKQVYAMKVISKRLLKRKSGYVENVQAERNILTKVRHPFVVTMHCSFQSREKLFIIMDFLAGGELFLRIGREGIFLEKEAAFYLAEIILALDHLHNLGILHRDLKPENILLGSDGHVCLTDFGLAKDFSGDVGGFRGEENRADTICGTMEYMAPEMVARQGYGRAADYWSLGCIAYEMLSGLPPFSSKQGAKELFRKIMSERVKMPPGSTAAACKFLKGLLNRDVQKRWGTSKSTMFEVGGVACVKQADFFKGIDWDKLEKKEVTPPAVMSVQNEDDLKHFHDEFTTMTLPRSVVEMSKDDFHPKRVKSETFRGFSFIQEDFNLPERAEEELDSYWRAVQEDGESVSDCASSKVDSTEVMAEKVPEKKKRPPRKRKKKKNAAGAPAGNTPVHSTATTPIHSVATTPAPSENGDILVESVTKGIPKKDEVLPVTPDPFNASKEKKPEDKPSPLPKPSSRTQPLLGSVSVPSATPNKAKPAETAWQNVSSTKKKAGKDNKSAKNNGPWQSSPQKRLDYSKNPGKPASGGFAPSSRHPMQSPATTQNSWGQRTGQGNSTWDNRRPNGSQQQAPQSRWPSPTGKSSSDWQQHSRASAQPQQWGQASNMPVHTESSQPSSDWRQHSMSPLSNKSLRQIRHPHPEQPEPSWPILNLNNDDPPLPTKSSAKKPTSNLQGAWASRTKR